MHPARLLAAALLTASLCASANADLLFGNNCRVDLHCFETSNGVYAVVAVDSTWGFMIDADLHLSVNNQELKLEPFRTDTEFVLVTWIAPAGRTVTACAHVIGRSLTDVENWMPADSTDCAFFSSEQGPRPNVPVAVTQPRPVAGASRQSAVIR